MAAHGNHARSKTSAVANAFSVAGVPEHDTVGLKERLRDALAKNRHDVTMFYKDTGRCQEVARSQWFELLVLGVICFNAIWIWIEVDYNTAKKLKDAHPVFIAAEIFLCVFFSSEWIIRFIAFRRKCDCFKDGWFMFDSALVFMMVFELTVLSALVESGLLDIGDELSKASILRLLRLLRLTRIGKLMAYIPEIMILIKGMAEGMRSVSLTMVLLGLIIYVVAIAARQIADGSEVGAKYFSTVPESMYTLLIHGMVPDIGDVMEDLRVEWYIAIIFVLFVFFSTFTILNMLIGILCEVVSNVKNAEKEELDKAWLKSTLKTIMENEIDTDHDGYISKSEFLLILEKPKAVGALSKMGYDVPALVDLSDLLFPEDEDVPEGVKLTFDEFISVLIQSRATFATQKDVRDLRKFIAQMFDKAGLSGNARRVSSKEPIPQLETPEVFKPQPDAATDLLMARIDRLESLLTTAAESQPEVMKRMSNLETLVDSLAKNQKGLMERIPQLDVLVRLSEQLAVPQQPGFGARSAAQSQNTSRGREMNPCGTMLFCAGPTPRDMPSSGAGLPNAGAGQMRPSVLAVRPGV